MASVAWRLPLPLVCRVRWRTVAKVLSMGLVVRRWAQCSAGKSLQAFKHQLDVPVVSMSGYDEQEAFSRFHGNGLAGFVMKPFDPETLMLRIKKALT